MILSVKVFSIDLDSSRVVKFDTNYIHSYPNYLSIAIFNNLPSINFKIGNAKKEQSKLTSYKSNITNVVGFDLDYQGISLMVGFKAKNNIQNVNTKGKSDFNLFGIKMYRHRYFANVSYMYAKSFYDDNSYLKFDGSSPEHPFIVRPDLTYKKLNIYVMYNINHKKYSYLAPLSYTERQLRSKGGWLVAGGLYYYQLKDTGALGNLPPKTIEKFEVDTTNKQLNTYFMKAGFGRGLNLIISKRIFLNVQTLVSGNLAFLKTNDDKNKNYYVSPNVFLELSAGLGYNSRRFFAGLRIAGDRNVFRRSAIKYINTTSYAQLNIGYRFNSPKWLDKGYSSIKDKITGISIQKN